MCILNIVSTIKKISEISMNSETLSSKTVIVKLDLLKKQLLFNKTLEKK